MARLGKRLLSAFMEVTEDKKDKSPDATGFSSDTGAEPSRTTATPPVGPELSGTTARPAAGGASGSTDAAGASDQRFADYFDRLFSDANIPGPDYYEFSKMIGAMQLIPDEQSRFNAAYAGLHVQGLDKQKLLSTAAEYLRMLIADSDQFRKTVETALQEKVQSRTDEAEQKARRIQVLSQEIAQLQADIAAMQQEIGENKEKLMASSNAYATEYNRRKQQIETEMQKIDHYIH